LFFYFLAYANNKTKNISCQEIIYPPAPPPKEKRIPQKALPETAAAIFIILSQNIYL
jgi:hypothetical protein